MAKISSILFLRSQKAITSSISSNCKDTLHCVKKSSHDLMVSVTKIPTAGLP